MQSVPQPILDLIGRANVRTVALSPRGNAWHMVSDERSAVLRCSTQTLGHVVWLHQFLHRLAASAFPSPVPLPILGGSSIVACEGQVWETLSFLPGRAMRLDDAVPLESAGALLARFHEASLAVSSSVQRPGALPMEACRPRSHPRIAEDFLRELADLGHQRVSRCVVWRLYRGEYSGG
jgi:Ser/Thr protein kinase RdoA (MazF antagonist)